VAGGWVNRVGQSEGVSCPGRRADRDLGRRRKHFYIHMGTLVGGEVHLGIRGRRMSSTRCLRGGGST